MPSKQALINQQQRAWEEIQKQRGSYTAATAMLLVVTMIELADADPRIAAFEFDANFEYDDEGGYFWSESYFALDAEGERLDDDDYAMMDRLLDALRECGAEEESIMLAFGSETAFDGKVTVEDLRAQGTATPTGAAQGKELA